MSTLSILLDKIKNHILGCIIVSVSHSFSLSLLLFIIFFFNQNTEIQTFFETNNFVRDSSVVSVHACSLICTRFKHGKWWFFLKNFQKCAQIIEINCAIFEALRSHTERRITSSRQRLPELLRSSPIEPIQCQHKNKNNIDSVWIHWYTKHSVNLSMYVRPICYFANWLTSFHSNGIEKIFPKSNFVFFFFLFLKLFALIFALIFQFHLFNSKSHFILTFSIANAVPNTIEMGDLSNYT